MGFSAVVAVAVVFVLVLALDLVRTVTCAALGKLTECSRERARVRRGERGDTDC